MKNLSMQDLFAGSISIAVIVGFFSVIGLQYFHTVPDSPGAQQLTGALIAAFTGVMNYWVGSSRSSQVKDQTIGQMAAIQPALLATPPAKANP